MSERERIEEEIDEWAEREAEMEYPEFDNRAEQVRRIAKHFAAEGMRAAARIIHELYLNEAACDATHGLSADRSMYASGVLAKLENRLYAEADAVEGKE